MFCGSSLVIGELLSSSVYAKHDRWHSLFAISNMCVKAKNMAGMLLSVSGERQGPQMPAEEEGSSCGEHLCLGGLGEPLSEGDAPTGLWPFAVSALLTCAQQTEGLLQVSGQSLIFCRLSN